MVHSRGTSVEKSVRRRELREFIKREIKAYIGAVGPMPERLADLIKQLVQRLDERENASGELHIIKRTRGHRRE
jgi:hypothetical protein